MAPLCQAALSNTLKLCAMAYVLLCTAVQSAYAKPPVHGRLPGSPGDRPPPPLWGEGHIPQELALAIGLVQVLIILGALALAIWPPAALGGAAAAPTKPKQEGANRPEPGKS